MYAYSDYFRNKKVDCEDLFAVLTCASIGVTDSAQETVGNISAEHAWKTPDK